MTNGDNGLFSKEKKLNRPDGTRREGRRVMKGFRYAPGKAAGAMMLAAFFLAVAGFDFTKHSIPVDEIISGGPGKDGIPSLTEPEFISPDQAEYLRPGDRVIGVAMGGEARAYPVSILNWHEAVNDRLAGSAILVTW